MRRWTPDERQRQAALIRNWKPWERSTGPKTLAGKAKSSKNADQPNALPRRIRELQRQVRELAKQFKVR